MPAKIKRVSKAEELLMIHIKAHKLRVPEREYRFHPDRRWRFDFAWVDIKLAVEVDGVLWDKQGRHQRPKGMANDNDKNNEAVLLGWRVLYFTPAQIKNLQAVDTLEKFLVD